MNSKKEPTKEDLEKEIEILKLKIRIAELEKELAEKEQKTKTNFIPVSTPKIPYWQPDWYREWYRDGKSLKFTSYNYKIKNEGEEHEE